MTAHQGSFLLQLAQTCKLTAERPSRRFGLRDEAVAFDFDAAAALVLRLHEERLQARCAAMAAGLGWGEDDGQSEQGNVKEEVW